MLKRGNLNSTLNLFLTLALFPKYVVNKVFAAAATFPDHCRFKSH
jgi:hypothetical protein